MLKGGKKGQLVYTPAARHAFMELKQQFLSAPILKMPDPNKPFIIEVDASEVGLGAVLSQRHGNPEKLYPWSDI